MPGEMDVDSGVGALCVTLLASSESHYSLNSLESLLGIYLDPMKLWFQVMAFSNLVIRLHLLSVGHG